MKIQKFIAPSVPLALRQVHEDLGDRAVILNTRTLPAGGDPNVRVEVTATLGEESVAPMAMATSGQQVASEARPARGARPDLLGRVYGRSRPAGDSPRGPRWRETVPGPQVEERDIRSAAAWLASLPAVQRDTTERMRPEPQEPPAQKHDTTEGAGDSVVIGQLRQLEKAVHRMASQAGGFELSPELSRLGERLRLTGLSGDHVHRCLQAVMRELSNEELDARDAIARAAARCMTGLLAGVSEIRIGRRRKVVALVGPSGSGKTTAAARIAAGFVRRRQRRGGGRRTATSSSSISILGVSVHRRSPVPLLT